MLDCSRILISKKLSILEYEMKKTGKSQQELLDNYKKKGADWERILKSHQNQQRSLEKILRYFSNSKPALIEGRQLTKKIAKKYSILISLGGDNHFLYVSHFLSDQYLIGVNSDPEFSEGLLNYFNADSFSKLLASLEKKELFSENWTRILVKKNGVKLRALAASEVYIGSRERMVISRYKIDVLGKSEVVKNSGLLVATGAGSGGWFHSATSCIHEEGKIYPKTVSNIYYFTTESFFGRIHKKNLFYGKLEGGQKIKLVSFSKYDSVISIDSRVNYSFPRGTKVEIEIANQLLKVVTN